MVVVEVDGGLLEGDSEVLDEDAPAVERIEVVLPISGREAVGVEEGVGLVDDPLDVVYYLLLEERVDLAEGE